MLDIRVLGSPVVTVGGDPIAVDTKKAIAMLVYLVVEGGAVDRDVLAGLFWGDFAPDRARATLRRTLSALRGGIGAAALQTNRDRVELVAGYWSDIDHFEAALAETKDHAHDGRQVCPRCVEPLSAASELYRGDFLGSFSVREAPDFEHWARSITESTRARAGDMFSRLALALATTSDYARAIETATRWIGLDELHEPAHRMLMLLHAWSGDRPGAIQAYRGCVATLDRELGVPPLEETTELYEAILDEDLPPAPGVPRPLRAVQPPASPAEPRGMLDRHGERDALALALEASREAGSVTIITGDSWMGKTRLIEELIEMATNGGRSVVSARGFRAEEALPYGIATQLLHSLVVVLKESGSELPDWAQFELTRLDPTLSPGRAPETPERVGQLRLHEAFVKLLETATSTTPVLVTVDDAQWVDPASAALLAYLSRRLEHLPLLMVLATRDGKDLSSALREAVTQSAEHIPLLPLTLSDLEHRPELEKVLEETGGIPLLVQEAIAEEATAPKASSVARYLDTRRDRLSDLAQQALAAAAVLSGLCDASLLRDTSGRTDDEIVEAVEELVSAGLLEEEASGRLGFVLEAMEKVTYDSTSLIRRRLLHRRAAESISARPRSHTDARLATAIAGHLHAAGGDDAAEWYRRAGDLARAMFANDEAVVSYETAIALGHPEIGKLHLALGELAMAQGDYRRALVELRSAAAQCVGPDLAIVEHRTGDLNRILGRFELAEECFVRARDTHPQPASLNADWAMLEYRLGNTEGAARLATASLEAAQAEGQDRAVARALNILALVSPDPADAMSHVEAALSVAGDDPLARMAALNNKASLLAGSGELDAAAALVSEAVDLAGRTGYRHQQAALLDHLADLCHQAGRQQEAEAALTEAVTLFADVAAGEWEPEVWLLRFW